MKKAYEMLNDSYGKIKVIVDWVEANIAILNIKSLF